MPLPAILAANVIRTAAVRGLPWLTRTIPKLRAAFPSFTKASARQLKKEATKAISKNSRRALPRLATQGGRRQALRQTMQQGGRQRAAAGAARQETRRQTRRQTRQQPSNLNRRDLIRPLQRDSYTGRTLNIRPRGSRYANRRAFLGQSNVPPVTPFNVARAQAARTAASSTAQKGATGKLAKIVGSKEQLGKRLRQLTYLGLGGAAAAPLVKKLAKDYRESDNPKEQEDLLNQINDLMESPQLGDRSRAISDILGSGKAAKDQIADLEELQKKREERRVGRKERKEEQRATSAKNRREEIGQYLQMRMRQDANYWLKPENQEEKMALHLEGKRLGGGAAISTDEFNRAINSFAKKANELEAERVREKDRAEGDAWRNDRLLASAMDDRALSPSTAAQKGKSIARFQEAAGLTGSKGKPEPVEEAGDMSPKEEATAPMGGKGKVKKKRGQRGMRGRMIESAISGLQGRAKEEEKIGTQQDTIAQLETKYGEAQTQGGIRMPVYAMAKDDPDNPLYKEVNEALEKGGVAPRSKRNPRGYDPLYKF